MTKAKKQLADLNSQLTNVSGNEAIEFKKIKNVRENANSKKKREEYSRATKR